MPPHHPPAPGSSPAKRTTSPAGRKNILFFWLRPVRRRALPRKRENGGCGNARMGGKTPHTPDPRGNGESRPCREKFPPGWQRNHPLRIGRHGRRLPGRSRTGIGEDKSPCPKNRPLARNSIRDRRFPPPGRSWQDKRSRRARRLISVGLPPASKNHLRAKLSWERQTVPELRPAFSAGRLPFRVA